MGDKEVKETDKDRSIYLTDKELLYAATVRCRCGAGLAYPMDQELSLHIRAWVCSAVLKGETGGVRATRKDWFVGNVPVGQHDALDWAMWKVREETSINNHGGHTTRPPGTYARTVGNAKCPKCEHTWESEPYIACGLGHHWFCGPCPGCGYTIGAGGTYSTRQGTPIETRYLDVILDEEKRP